MSIEHERLKHEARPLGLFVGQHREWKTGPYFVSIMGEQQNQLAKFQTAAQVRALLASYVPGKPLPPPVNEELTKLAVLQAKARPLGFFIGEHKGFDPCRGGGEFYVMFGKRHPHYEKHRNDPTLRKFQTAEQIEEFLELEADYYAA